MKLSVRAYCTLLKTMRTLCLLGAAATVLNASPTQNELDAGEEVKQLVVMIACRIPEKEIEVIGAGVIFGIENDRLYIATAEHVVLPCAQESRDLKIRIRGVEKDIRATVLKHLSSWDLAVLSVTGLKGLGLNVSGLPFDRLGDPNSLKRGDNLYSLGNPANGKPWGVNVVGEPLSEIEEDRLYYNSEFISPGHSGGALLNQDFEVVGMIRSDQRPKGEAISISRVLETLKQWGYPVNLHRPSALTTFASITVGESHTCGLSRRGAAYCWGASGRLGNGLEGTNVKRVSGGLVFRSLSAGQDHTCGVTTTDVAYCWGSNTWGELGNGSQTPSNVPVAVAGNIRFRSVTAGGQHSCGLTPGGVAYCWGKNDHGQLGDGSEDNSRVPVRVAEDPVQARTGLSFKSLSAGGLRTCGITIDDLAYCWGAPGIVDKGGESIRGNEESHVPVAVPGNLRLASISSSPYRHTCGVTTNGAALCWGENNHGQVGNGSDESSVTPTPVLGGLSFKSVNAGKLYTCGVTTSGEAYCWGDNSDGQLGNGSKDRSNLPVPVFGNLNFVSVSCGFSTAYAAVFIGGVSANRSSNFTCGLTAAGAVYCWGWVQESGQGGNDYPVRSTVLVPKLIHP